MIEPEDGIYHGDFHVGLTASVRAATLAFGGPEPDHPIPGTEVHLRIVDFQGPPGGILHFWESGQLAPTFSLEGNQASGLTWKVSGNGGLAGADPYGHIHGRRFSTSVQGRYQLTLIAYDHALNAPGNEPWHTESEPLSIVFQAGENGVIPPVEKTPVHYFEARQTHPLEVTPSGHHLLALNSGESRLSIFSLSGNREHLPVLIGEIPTGLTPVSVRARTDDEVWVVNEVSDSISVISLAHMAVIETISVPDEPADVVFSGDLAYVSCSQINAIRVIDCRDYFELQMIPLRGLAPRNLSVSGDGLSIFVSFLHSGNGTTILPADESRPQPTPWNPDLPPPPLDGHCSGFTSRCAIPGH
ncbi:MAG: hypothetical protein LR011_14405 [Verrucomicrobia bacterium]|nr:hypothetical protein [Verrucomicrobiota bacterium]